MGNIHKSLTDSISQLAAWFIRRAYQFSQIVVEIVACHLCICA
jgi:hypothetical protein